MEAIRFKWTVRHEDNGHYFVDETIGDNSRPITSGPMSAESAIRFVDGQRERGATAIRAFEKRNDRTRRRGRYSP